MNNEYSIQTEKRPNGLFLAIGFKASRETISGLEVIEIVEHSSREKAVRFLRSHCPEFVKAPVTAR